MHEQARAADCGSRTWAGPWWLRLPAALAVLIAAVAGAAWAVQAGWLLLAAGLGPLGLAAAGWLTISGTGRWGRRRLIGCAFLVAISMPPLGLWVYQVSSLYGPRPQPTRQMLFEGVEYIRKVVEEPHPAIVHVIRVDLAAEGVEVLVTPPDFPGEELAFKARRTSTFLREAGLQVALNAGHYHPFRTQPLWAVYPRPGDPVGVLGASASRGEVYAEPREHFPMLNIGPANRAVIAEHPPEPFYNAVTGVKHFLRAGRPTSGAGQEERGARTLVYLDEPGRTLFLVAVDGDQPPYSAGLGRAAVNRLLEPYGVHDGLALDGGGASTMAIEGPNGRPQRLNRPVNLGIPGFERPVATHIGIYARPLGARQSP